MATQHLKGKTAIITGAGRGIGKAIALDLAKEKCNVVIVSKNVKEINQVSNEIQSSGGNAFALPLDISVENNINFLVKEALNRFKTIDILINNAGIIAPKPLMEVSVEQWDKTMNVNLRSIFILTKEVLKIMIEKQKGYIINISSTAVFNVPANLADYGVSKAGIKALSQSIYETSKKYNIKVSTIFPGVTDTKMVRDINLPSTPDKWMLPEDISNCVLFLLKQNDRVFIEDLIAVPSKM